MFEGEITCPWCNHKGRDFKFEKEWTNETRTVNRFQCPNCNEYFRVYFGGRKDGSQFQYYIRGR